VWSDVDFKNTPRNVLKDNYKKFPLKSSIIVKSGGGVHFYWLLKEPIEQSEISRVENINKRIATVMGGDINACDAARILRIPNTINHKYPAPVEITRLNDFRYELEDFLILPGEERLKEGSKSIGDVGKKILDCQFLKWCKENPEKVSEPLWYALISNLISIRPGGYSLCHEFSKGYPKYTKEETNTKIMHALDSSKPHTCSFIKENGYDCGKECPTKSPAGLLFSQYYHDGDQGNGSKRIRFHFI
jgi:putative DNA primase/helicase